jgi:anaerobic selenocysteine-containing dehydrogenase
MLRVVKTACPLDCFDACGVVAEVDGDRIVRIGGDADHPFTRGALCHKVNRFLEDRQYNAERITHPLRRGPRGWERIGWDEALDLAASKLGGARDRHGSLSVLFHRGNGSFAALKCMVNRFFNLFGGATEAVGRYCAGEGDYGTRLAFGDCQIHDPIDLREHSNLFLVWGRNPAVTNIHMMPVLKAARARGARAILIDPVRTKSARYVDDAVHPRPGSDGALALGMAKVLLERRPVDTGRLAAIGERVEAYLGLVRGTSLDEVARRTDLPREAIERLALEYFDRKPATILEGVGLQQYTKGHQTCQLIAALGVLSGNVGIPGGGVNMMNWPWQAIRTPTLQAEAARTSPPRTLPVSRLGEALASAADPPVTTAFFMQSNLVNQMPDTPAIKAALSRLEFVICLDQFLTDTAETAHLFLPTTTFLEEEDLVPSYGHHWMQLMQPVAPPLGESRSDLHILQALGGRLGFGAGMAGSAGEWIDEASAPLRTAGIGYAALKAAGGRLWPEGQPRVPWADGRFATPSGRFVFPDRFEDEPGLPTAEFPLHLIAQATAASMNSQILEADQQGFVTASVSPAAALLAGVADGDRAALVSPRGRLDVRVEVDATLRADTVVVAKGGWHKHGRNMNVLVEPRFTAGTGSAFNQNCVRLESIPRTAAR